MTNKNTDENINKEPRTMMTQEEIDKSNRAMADKILMVLKESSITTSDNIIGYTFLIVVIILIGASIYFHLILYVLLGISIVYFSFRYVLGKDLIRIITGTTICGTPFIQMEQAEREAYNRMTPEERLEKEKAYEIYKKKENLLNIIRFILLILIIVGLILLCTQKFWVDNLVTFILQHSK